MKFYNRQFGELEIEDQHILRFPEGLIGFEDHRSFLLIRDEDTEPLRWLVSLDDADVCFPLLDPQLLKPEYRTYLSIPDHEDVYAVTTLLPAITDSTVNLRSPVVIDPITKTGRQIVLDNESLSFEYPLLVSEGSEPKE